MQKQILFDFFLFLVKSSSLYVNFESETLNTVITYNFINDSKV